MIDASSDFINGFFNKCVQVQSIQYNPSMVPSSLTSYFIPFSGHFTVAVGRTSSRIQVTTDMALLVSQYLRLRILDL